jgi:hypothetical protein
LPDVRTRGKCSGLPIDRREPQVMKAACDKDDRCGRGSGRYTVKLGEISRLASRNNRALDALRLDKHAEDVVRQAAAAVETDDERVLVAEPGFDLGLGRGGRPDKGRKISYLVCELGRETLAAG